METDKTLIETDKTLENKKNFLLVDTHAMIYRLGYSLQDMNNSKKHPVGAIWGSLRILIEINKKYDIFSTIFALDNAKNNRKTEYAKYKENRKPTPDFLRQQFPMFIKVINHMKSYNFTYEGFEADDVIASLVAKISQQKQCHTYILTTDKDLLQLVGPSCSVLLLGTGGLRCIENNEQVESIVGVSAHQYADYLALAGDATDKIPGIAGIGGKAAIHLLQEFSSLDNILQNISLISNLKMRTKVENGIENAILSKSLSLLRILDIDVNTSFFQYRNNYHTWSKNIELLDYLQNDLDIDMLLL